ncbi:hypothetical protein H8R18_02140 [Nanchangia anserum]|uniref:Uncharacterized protein n=1 Tax=Nanchangia anserum TaxID=2692125 RepID=A0A8I0KUS7_9ACTO|nr:hypothetical protein [Nanchangia anserum]MBD3690023.1 hypothetical protein [Nanchangia anserum]QOX82180.1 hypothetical protein H8R18_02140 [Nanchangia anserum]
MYPYAHYKSADLAHLETISMSLALRIATVGFIVCGVLLVVSGVTASSVILSVAGGLLVAIAGMGLAATFFVHSLRS